MTGYQRIKAALEGRMPDRRPVMLHNFMVAAREAGHTLKQYREDPRIAARCHIQAVEKYNLDGILFDVDTALIAGAVGVPADYPADEPARTHQLMIDSPEGIDDLQPVDISRDERILHALEAVGILKDYFGDEVFVRGNCDQAPFSLACSVRSPAAFMMDLIMEPERAQRLLEWCVGPCLQYIGLMAATGADMISNGDSPAGPSMISSEMYETFALPYEKMLAQEAHRLGLPYLMHICGNTGAILEQMASAGFDAVELDYLTPADRIVHCLGRRVTLFGTVDPSGTMALGSPADVRRECEKILYHYKGNPCLVLGPGCALPPITPEENIRAMVAAAQSERVMETAC